MSPIVTMPGGPDNGTPCGCTKTNLTAVQQLMVNDGVSYGYCGSSPFVGGNSLSVTGSPTPVNRCFNNICDGYTFSDNTQYYSPVVSLDLSYPVDFSFEFWGKVVATPATTEWVIRHWGPDTTIRQYAIQWDGAGGLIGTAYTTAMTGPSMGASSTLVLNQCFQYVTTFTAATGVFRSYGNGALFQTVTPISNPLNTTPGQPTQFYGWPIAQMIFGYYKGTALSATQVAAHWGARN